MVALVLLPGLDGTGRLFVDFVAALGAEVEVTVASYPTDTPLGYAELTAVARSFLPPDQPFFLLAESFSGPIAISIAQSSPPGLLGVALCCSFARNPLPVLAPARPLLGIVPVDALPVALLSFFVLGRFHRLRFVPRWRALSQPLLQRFSGRERVPFCRWMFRLCSLISACRSSTCEPLRIALCRVRRPSCWSLGHPAPSLSNSPLRTFCCRSCRLRPPQR